MNAITYFLSKNSLSKKAAFLTIALFSFVAFGCDSNDDDDEGTIVQVATDNGFDTLVAAIEAADLVDTLEGPGPFTVFAPTDEAFAALPAGTLDDLLLPENQAALADILTYHVVSGEVTADQVVNLPSATTVQGQDIAISVVNGMVMLNGTVTVTTTDVEASNGVIHIIDGVLLPPTN